MRSFWGLGYLLAALVLAFAEPAVSHPIRSSKWIKMTEFKDFEARGVWKVIEKKETFYVPELEVSRHASTESAIQPQMNLEKGLPGRRYKRDTSSETSTDSVLVPGNPASEQVESLRRWDYNEHADSSGATHKSKPYGQVLGHSEDDTSETYESENVSSNSSSYSSPLRLASSHYISFFQYRISFPFLKFAPMSFPQFPLPSIFTTVMVILALVWIAILTIGLVEVGNYLWKRRQTARLAAECERLANEESSTSTECLKEPFQVLVVPRAPWRPDPRRDEASEVLSSTSDDEFDIEMDEYRMPLP